MALPIPEKIPLIQQAISVLWPSFATAIVATGIFFSDIEVSPIAAYSIGFFIFWLLASVSSIGTLYFTITNCRFLNKQGS